MSSVNNILYSIQKMAPALLSIGGGAAKGNNYDALASLSNSLFGANSGAGSSLSSGLLGGSSSGSQAADKVSLNYKSIGDKMVNDMASITAAAIKENKELDGDYVIAIIEKDGSREARVYSRKEILANFEGTASEKKSLEKELAANPLMVFTSANGLPDTDPKEAYQKLASNINDFLKKNNKNMNTLAKAGYDPLASMAGGSSMKKILVNCAEAQEKTEDETAGKSERSKQLLKDLKEAVATAAGKEIALKDDYVAAIIEENGKREAMVYSRAEILKNFTGTEEEKAALEKQLKDNPLFVFLNKSGLEKTPESGAYAEMATAINDFLSKNSAELDELDKAGFDPLADILGDSTLKKALAGY